MKKYRLNIIILIFVLAAFMPGYASVKNVSRNGKDKVEIKKITPRTFSYLLKPVNMPVHVEFDYDLKTVKKGKAIIRVYKANRDLSKYENIKELSKVIQLSTPKSSVTHSTPPLKLKTDSEYVFIYTTVILTDANDNELAFSSSKNFILGTYEILKEKGSPFRNQIELVAVLPPKSSDISVNKNINFSIVLKYSVRSKPMAYVDVLFLDRSDFGTGNCWKAATVAVPRGQGKLVLKPVIRFPEALASRNIGIEILFWLEPLKSANKFIRIQDYFLVKKK